MSSQRPSAVPASVVDLVGFAAYSELAEFGLLATRSVDAPDLDTRQALADGAERALERERAMLAVVGGPRAAVMAPFADTLTEFDARTRTDDWAEGLLKGVVGHGVAQDFCRTLAASIEDPVGRRLREVLDRPVPGPAAVAEAGADAEAIEVLGRLGAADEVLASRLALWGRRVVGEALNLVTVLLATHPGLDDLASRAPAALGADVGDGGSRAWIVARLTAEHTRRMDRLQLAA
ncbi:MULTISPECIES: ferritin-like fold-containing protein [unclassified Isoptericola]|uniref:ferritin-like fold-containing protein n=1 Tax=unclassified Isoptericola TaxID=2623355 RepID=UPI0027141CB2|nr:MULTISPECIES: ferritin-like fold-containing protein [unclassified Isoptericola]MDO8144213.1 ferritin-like fold-containing protein [Isoptericola sp. 178]MDO8148067.1 ferritin-like fold-containing protein [Isoptericola sp. b515]MDO8151542.1 ferritin-like fold-containing protein [Isoptericola sp. b408]